METDSVFLCLLQVLEKLSLSIIRKLYHREIKIQRYLRQHQQDSLSTHREQLHKVKSLRLIDAGRMTI